MPLFDLSALRDFTTHNYGRYNRRVSARAGFGWAVKKLVPIIVAPVSGDVTLMLNDYKTYRNEQTPRIAWRMYIREFVGPRAMMIFGYNQRREFECERRENISSQLSRCARALLWVVSGNGGLNAIFAKRRRRLCRTLSVHTYARDISNISSTIYCYDL